LNAYPTQTTVDSKCEIHNFQHLPSFPTWTDNTTCLTPTQLLNVLTVTTSDFQIQQLLTREYVLDKSENNTQILDCHLLTRLQFKYVVNLDDRHFRQGLLLIGMSSMWATYKNFLTFCVTSCEKNLFW